MGWSFVLGLGLTAELGSLGPLGIFLGLSDHRLGHKIGYLVDLFLDMHYWFGARFLDFRLLEVVGNGLSEVVLVGGLDGLHELLVVAISLVLAPT